ncbi:hypothetical protein C0995_004973 [Termitomyces sp. Mi166|nr:hypothetical protein C0995_004973 [Termitomyces sp. Mi166\
MSKDPPSQFVVPEGKLLYDEHWDGHYQYFYEVPSHPLVCRDVIGQECTFVYIQDTSPEVMDQQWLFEDSIQIPHSQNEKMKELGLFELSDGDIIFAHNLHGPRDADGNLLATNDCPMAWCTDGTHTLSNSVQEDLAKAQSLVLGN